MTFEHLNQGHGDADKLLFVSAVCPEREQTILRSNKKEVLRAKIDAECPLVPVPPHGDLIDRDAYQYSGDLMDEPVIIPAEEEE